MRILRINAAWFVGMFLSLVLIGLFFLFFYNPHTRYLTYIQESVSGLSVGSRVEYNGVEVGSVKRIKINQTNPKLIDVVLCIEKSAPVTAGTVAMLAVSDTKGPPFIALKDDGGNLKPLIETPDSGYRVIPSVPSTKANPNVSLTQIAISLKQFNDTIQAFMNKDDLESFKQLLYSMQKVMGMLAENSERMGHLIVNTEKASNQFGSFLASSQHTIRTLETQTLPSTYRLISNMDDMLNKMSGMMADISQNPSVIIRGKVQPPPGPGE